MNGKKENKNCPKSVMVAGQLVTVNMDEKGKGTTDIPDPRKAIKTSPFSELLPADDAWINKYGGSDVSIVAFNVAVILNPDIIKEKSSDNEDEGKDEG